MRLGLLVLLLLATLAACDTLGGRTTSDADLQGRGIDTARLLEWVENEDDPAVLIDVRSPERFAAGHLPGAINLPLPQIRPADPRLVNAPALIVTGEGWTDPLTSAAAKKLISLGYPHVYDYRGGLELWREEGRPIVDSPSR